MIHLIDYETLKEWGFVWATKVDYGHGDVVTSYIKKESYETDAHGFNSIILTMIPHPNVNKIWVIRYLDSGSGENILFKGIIKSKTTLKCILKSCLFFKPENINNH